MVDMVSQDILVPTDFGPGSRLAWNAPFGVSDLRGNICVLHVLDQHLIDQTRTLLPEIGETELRAR
jgi:hypothetical protein